jgi:isochorismate synthase
MLLQATSSSPDSRPLGEALTRDVPFFFAGPTRTLLAHDGGQAVRGCLDDGERLLAAAERLARESASQLVVGAIPFSTQSEVRLFSPERVTRSGRWWVEAKSGHEARRFCSQPSRRDEDDGAAFVRSVEAATRAIEAGDMRKVVLSRVREVLFERAPDLGHLLSALRTQNAHGFIFALGLPRRGTLVGASPELLLSKRGSRVLSAPLAGSAPRTNDAAENARRAAALLASPKDRHEHAIVVEQVAAALAPFTRALHVSPTPHIVETPTLLHLASRIEGTLIDRGVSSLRLAAALHPTPAVCGTPTQAAAAFIAREEPFDRGYFTGSLGHMDASGDGDWIVTIRCAEVFESHARVFAGAGIVGSSLAAAELRETEVKMQTVLNALGLGGHI